MPRERPRERKTLAQTRHARRGRSIFLWEDVEPSWPRRLLHIPSMTSVERGDGNTYGPNDEKEPDYSILTYTWGRWPAPDGSPHIPVSGTTWAIPAVDSGKFSVAQFAAVIRKMGQAHDFAWIDVVCIDQEDYAVKMEEIGRQVGIFANASQVYVWLWSLPSARLQDVYDDITRCSAALDVDAGTFRPLPRMMASSSVMYDDTAPPQEGDGGTFDHQIPHAVLSSLAASIKALLGDPWFSSLWTLQEGLLRQDAIFLSQDAECVHHRVGIASPEAEMVSLSRAFSTIRAALEQYDGRSTPREPSPYGGLVDSVIEAIKRAGYPARTLANNPNIQWAAAQLRNATNAEDRIYGIMALYNIQVGDAAPSAAIKRNKNPSLLPELEREFAVTLNAKSPLLGQLFVHAGPGRRPRGGRKSWEISRDVRVPHGFAYWDEQQFSNYCSITGSTSTGLAEVRGPVCFLKDLQRLWMASARQKESYAMTYNFDIVLDEYVVEEHPAIIAAAPTSRAAAADRVNATFILIDTVSEEFGEDAVSVLELGGWMREVYGLLLLHPPSDRSRAKRIGICKWDRNNVARLAEPVKAVVYEGLLE